MAKLSNEELLREEQRQPIQWWYVSFADDASHGVVIIEAHGLMDALEKCRALNIVPRGEVLGAPMPDEVLAQVPQASRGRLLSSEELSRIWPPGL
jgi:hypothetical protein